MIVAALLPCMGVQSAFAQGAGNPRPRHNLPFIYYLQNLNAQRLAQINPAVAVVDPYDTHLTSEEIRMLRAHYGQKLIAYLSAGEVDPSRRDAADGYAFQQEWKQKDWYKNVPASVRSNDNWGSRRIEYWDPEWRDIMARRVEAAAARGYDGVMLDTVDTYYMFQDAYKRDVKQDMAELVGHVRDTGRAKNPKFLVYINGGMELYATRYQKTGEEFLNLIDGQLKEDTWHNERGVIQAEWTDDDIAWLRRAVAAGKPVYTIDYFTGGKTKMPHRGRMTHYMRSARSLGAVPFAADRSLGIYLPFNTEYYRENAHWDTARRAQAEP
jgi:uncharacterized protein (TIGR01370 family)